MKKIYNTDLYEKVIAFATNDCKEFNIKRRELKMIGYKIKKNVLTNDGTYKLLAKLKKKSLVECLLREKQLQTEDHTSNTDPKYCHFYRNGFCTCTDYTACLYQETEDHISVIKYMVENFKDSEYSIKYNASANPRMYEDTKFGRIYSHEYEHLNSESEKISGYDRLCGN